MPHTFLKFAEIFSRLARFTPKMPPKVYKSGQIVKKFLHFFGKYIAFFIK